MAVLAALAPETAWKWSAQSAHGHANLSQGLHGRPTGARASCNPAGGRAQRRNAQGDCTRARESRGPGAAQARAPAARALRMNAPTNPRKGI
eukprot:7461449-Pyramimonas_sp.AAC.1